MKKLLTLGVLAVSLLVGQNAFAHGDHVHPQGKLDEATAIQAATEGVGMLVEQGHEIADEKLDESWGSISPGNIRIAQKGNGYYIIGFEHPENDKTLYVLLSDVGELYDANFTGTFEGLE